MCHRPKHVSTVAVVAVAAVAVGSVGSEAAAAACDAVECVLRDLGLSRQLQRRQMYDTFLKDADDDQAISQAMPRT